MHAARFLFMPKAGHEPSGPLMHQHLTQFTNAYNATQ